MKIREALETDFDDVLLIERLAFGYDKEANLVRELLHDLVQNRYYLCLL